MANPDVELLQGFDGIPFRQEKGAQTPLLKKDDRLQPVEVRDAKIKVFDLSDEVQLKEYQDVWDLVAKGSVIISSEEKHWSEDKQNWKVFLRWAELFLEIPKGKVLYDGVNITYKGS